MLAYRFTLCYMRSRGNVLVMTTVIQFPSRDTRPLVEHVSSEVRALIGRHSVSQTTLARWLGITQPAVSARLRGETEWKVSEIDRIAEGFGIHPSELMGGHYSGPRPDGPDGLPIKHSTTDPHTFGSEGWEFESLRARHLHAA